MSGKAKDPRIPLYMRIRPDLKIWLEKQAKSENRSVSNLIERIIEKART
jgi:predicted CopG family antitoxin